MKQNGNRLKRFIFNTKNDNGFSLVELIIVIAIMAILAGALAPALIKYIQKAEDSTYMDAAGKVELAASAMIVDAGNDGYTVRRIVYNGNGADDSVGSGNIYCESNGSISDMTDATKKQEYFDSLINVMGLGSLTLSSANGTPLQLVYDASGNLQENDGSGNETMIILSKGGKKRVKLTYKSGGWEISEKY